MTDLEDAVRHALPALQELSGGRTTRSDTERELADLAAKYGVRAQLVEDVEGFDGSVHYGLILRGPGQVTVSLSVAAGTGLPWPLRGFPHSREFDLVEVNGEPITVAQAMNCLDTLFDDARMLRTVVDSGLIGQAFREFGLDVSAEELQETTDAYRRSLRLHSAEATTAWLRDQGLTTSLLAVRMLQLAALIKLRRHVTQTRLSNWLADNRADLDVVVVAWATGGPETAQALQADATAAIVAAWRSRREAGLAEWMVADLPQGFSRLRTATAGEVVAVEHDGAEAYASVVERRPAALDARTQEAVEERLFAEWLARRRTDARVTWFWGDRRRTERAVDA